MRQILMILLVTVPTLAFSLTIDSEELEVNLKERNAVFIGDVKVKSQNLDFVADIVEVIIDENTTDLSKLKSAKAYMKKGQVHGTVKTSNSTYIFSSNIITLDLKKEKVLIEGACLNDGNSNIIGDKIIYDMKTDIISASSNQGKQVKISISNVH